MIDTYSSSKSFNGAVFTAPVSGIYSFYVTVQQDSSTIGYVYLKRNRHNESPTTIAHGKRGDYGGVNGNVIVQSTIFLTKNDLVHVTFEGRLCDLADITTTYFEGRLISKIDSSMI